MRLKASVEGSGLPQSMKKEVLNGEERERGRIRRREERDRKKEEGDKGIVGIS